MLLKELSIAGTGQEFGCVSCPFLHTKYLSVNNDASWYVYKCTPMSFRSATSYSAH